MSAVYLLKNQQISTDYSSSAFNVGRRKPWIVMGWRFELPSGSGSNRLNMTFNQVTNILEPGVSVIKFPVSNSRLWEGPKIITSDGIAATTDPVEGAGVWRQVFVNKSWFEWFQIDFEYLGAGSQVFDVSLWVE